MRKVFASSTRSIQKESATTPIENCLCNLIEGFSLVWNQTWFILLYVFSKLFHVVVGLSQNYIRERIVTVPLRVRKAKSFEVRATQSFDLVFNDNESLSENGITLVHF